MLQVSAACVYSWHRRRRWRTTSLGARHIAYIGTSWVEHGTGLRAPKRSPFACCHRPEEKVYWHGGVGTLKGIPTVDISIEECVEIMCCMKDQRMRFHNGRNLSWQKKANVLQVILQLSWRNTFPSFFTSHFAHLKKNTSPSVLHKTFLSIWKHTFLDLFAKHVPFKFEGINWSINVPALGESEC